ncbi:MAG: nucleoside recognition domain-containing protein [Bacilli bacterium]
MINYIWYFLILIGISYSFFTGNASTINNIVLEASKEGIDLVLEMLPLLVLWMGIMNIAEKSGLLMKFAKLLKPFLKKLFPSVKNDEALGYIASNVACNALGLGSAATPFGLKAMKTLQEENPQKDTASEGMITFLVLNTSGVTIIPTTVIALRLASGSANPSEIIITSIIATVIASIAGLLLDYFIRKKKSL